MTETIWLPDDVARVPLVEVINKEQLLDVELSDIV